MERTEIGGTYLRVADPAWADPLDVSFAGKGSGGRRNPAGISCLYLNADIATARANVARLYAELPYGPEDLDPVTAPLLVTVEVPRGIATDAVTSVGLLSIDLPDTYPHDEAGNMIPHARCQPIGERAWHTRLDGIDARSAAPGGTRELAWFERGLPARQADTLPFDEWWPVTQ